MLQTGSPASLYRRFSTAICPNATKTRHQPSLRNPRGGPPLSIGDERL